MWCLSRLLSLFVGDLVPKEDPNWDNFLRLLKIEELIFAPKSSVKLAAYLSVLVADYLEEYNNLYEKGIIPKQHYMVHYFHEIVSYVLSLLLFDFLFIFRFFFFMEDFLNL